MNKKTLFASLRRILVPVVHGRSDDSALTIARSLAPEVVLVGVVLLPDDGSLSAGASKAQELRRLLRTLGRGEQVRARSQVLPVGCDLRGLAVDRQAARADRPPIVLWNQRWEYDKNPTEFFTVLQRLADEGVNFGVAVAGENLRQTPSEFIEARERLGERVVHWGYVEGRAAYGRLLAAADVVVSTAWHEFFGVATVEAIFCGCLPLLPNRLSYPELIPAAWHDLCLYADFDDLVARLRRALTERRPAPPELRQAMARFDWEALAPIYDDLLEEVARAGRCSPLTA